MCQTNISVQSPNFTDIHNIRVIIFAVCV